MQLQLDYATLIILNHLNNANACGTNSGHQALNIIERKKAPGHQSPNIIEQKLHGIKPSTLNEYAWTQHLTS
jgi:hypothetical protein